MAKPDDKDLFPIQKSQQPHPSAKAALTPSTSVSSLGSSHQRWEPLEHEQDLMDGEADDASAFSTAEIAEITQDNLLDFLLAKDRQEQERFVRIAAEVEAAMASLLAAQAEEESSHEDKFDAEEAWSVEGTKNQNSRNPQNSSEPQNSSDNQNSSETQNSRDPKNPTDNQNSLACQNPSAEASFAQLVQPGKAQASAAAAQSAPDRPGQGFRSPNQQVEFMVGVLALPHPRLTYQGQELPLSLQTTPQGLPRYRLVERISKVPNGNQVIAQREPFFEEVGFEDWDDETIARDLEHDVFDLKVNVPYYGHEPMLATRQEPQHKPLEGVVPALPGGRDLNPYIKPKQSLIPPGMPAGPLPGKHPNLFYIVNDKIGYWYDLSTGLPIAYDPKTVAEADLPPLLQRRQEWAELLSDYLPSQRYGELALQAELETLLAQETHPANSPLALYGASSYQTSSGLVTTLDFIDAEYLPSTSSVKGESFTLVNSSTELVLRYHDRSQVSLPKQGTLGRNLAGQTPKGRTLAATSLTGVSRLGLVAAGSWQDQERWRELNAPWLEDGLKIYPAQLDQNQVEHFGLSVNADVPVEVFPIEFGYYNGYFVFGEGTREYEVHRQLLEAQARSEIHGYRPMGKAKPPEVVVFDPTGSEEAFYSIEQDTNIGYWWTLNQGKLLGYDPTTVQGFDWVGYEGLLDKLEVNEYNQAYVQRAKALAKLNAEYQLANSPQHQRTLKQARLEKLRQNLSSYRQHPLAKSKLTLDYLPTQGLFTRLQAGNYAQAWQELLRAQAQELARLHLLRQAALQAQQELWGQELGLEQASLQAKPTLPLPELTPRGWAYHPHPNLQQACELVPDSELLLSLQAQIAQAQHEALAGLVEPDVSSDKPTLPTSCASPQATSFASTQPTSFAPTDKSPVGNSSAFVRLQRRFAKAATARAKARKKQLEKFVASQASLKVAPFNPEEHPDAYHLSDAETGIGYWVDTQGNFLAYNAYSLPNYNPLIDFNHPDYSLAKDPTSPGYVPYNYSDLQIALTRFNGYVQAYVHQQGKLARVQASQAGASLQQAQLALGQAEQALAQAKSMRRKTNRQRLKASGDFNDEDKNQQLAALKLSRQGLRQAQQNLEQVRLDYEQAQAWALGMQALGDFVERVRVETVLETWEETWEETFTPLNQPQSRFDLSQTSRLDLNQISHHKQSNSNLDQVPTSSLNWLDLFAYLETGSLPDLTPVLNYQTLVPIARQRYLLAKLGWSFADLEAVRGQDLLTDLLDADLAAEDLADLLRPEELSQAVDQVVAPAFIAGQVFPSLFLAWVDAVRHADKLNNIDRLKKLRWHEITAYPVIDEPGFSKFHRLGGFEKVEKVETLVGGLETQASKLASAVTDAQASLLLDPDAEVSLELGQDVGLASQVSPVAQACPVAQASGVNSAAGAHNQVPASQGRTTPHLGQPGQGSGQRLMPAITGTYGESYSYVHTSGVLVVEQKQRRHKLAGLTHPVTRKFTPAPGQLVSYDFFQACYPHMNQQKAQTSAATAPEQARAKPATRGWLPIPQLPTEPAADKMAFVGVVAQGQRQVNVALGTWAASPDEAYTGCFNYYQGQVDPDLAQEKQRVQEKQRAYEALVKQKPR